MAYIAWKTLSYSVILIHAANFWLGSGEFIEHCSQIARAYWERNRRGPNIVNDPLLRGKNAPLLRTRYEYFYCLHRLDGGADLVIAALMSCWKFCAKKKLFALAPIDPTPVSPIVEIAKSAKWKLCLVCWNFKFASTLQCSTTTALDCTHIRHQTLKRNNYKFLKARDQYCQNYDSWMEYYTVRVCYNVFISSLIGIKYFWFERQFSAILVYIL